MVSTGAMGHQVEPPPILVGRSALVASVESGVPGVRRRPAVAAGNRVVVVPKLWPVYLGGHHGVHREYWPGEARTTWVACGPRPTRRCQAPPSGMAMGGVTLGWTRTVAVLAWIHAWSILDGMAQVGLQELSWDVPLEVLRTLEREVEKGHCSWATAEAIARHVDLHGKPWAAETASLVEGLDLATQGWLEGQPWWRRWALEQVARSAQDTRTSEYSWVMQRSWSAHLLAPTSLGVWRGKTD